MPERDKIATHIPKHQGTVVLEDAGPNAAAIAVDTATHQLQFYANGAQRQAVDNFSTQTIAGTKTHTGTNTFSGTVAFTGATTKTSVVEQHASVAKIGTTAGWAVAAADNKNSLARCPASQTGATLVVPLSLRVGDVITGYYLVGQIESAGNTCTVDAALRKQTTAAADLSDAAVTNGAITQVSRTSDGMLSSSTAAVTGLSVTVAADETYYVLITVTTAASTDVDLQSVNVTKTAV